MHGLTVCKRWENGALVAYLLTIVVYLMTMNALCVGPTQFFRRGMVSGHKHRTDTLEDFTTLWTSVAWSLSSWIRIGSIMARDDISGPDGMTARMQPDTELLDPGPQAPNFNQHRNYI